MDAAHSASPISEQQSFISFSVFLVFFLVDPPLFWYMFFAGFRDRPGPPRHSFQIAPFPTVAVGNTLIIGFSLSVMNGAPISSLSRAYPHSPTGH